MVTVLLVTFNGEKYLEAQLESLLSQTFRDIRIVIRDSGSTDATIKIIERYGEIYKDKIEVCPSCTTTETTSESFFKMLEEYSDDYIMLCEQDDIWFPEKIEKTLSVMKKAENKYSKDMPFLVHTDLYLTDEKLHRISDSFTAYFGLAPERTAFNQLLMKNNITCCTVMINRALKEKLFALPYSLSHEWWLGLTAAAFGKVIYFNKPTALYRLKSPPTKERRITAPKSVLIQAKFLLDNYGALLSIKQKNLLEAVISLPELSLAKKIKTIKKYGLYTNNLFDILKIIAL